MAPENIKTLLLITQEDNILAQAFLFEVSRHYCSNGCRVQYIAPEPISALPPTVSDNEVLSDPEAMRLISFHYLPGKEDLRKHLASIHLVHKPPTVIVVQEMERYCSEEDSFLLSALLHNAAYTCGLRLNTPTVLVVSYKMPVPPIIVQKFFHNVWCIHSSGDDDEVTLHCINPFAKGPVAFQFSSTEDRAQLMLEKVFEVSMKEPKPDESGNTGEKTKS